MKKLLVVRGNDNKNKNDAENGGVKGKDVTTRPMPNLTGADITFTYEPSRWTKDSVTVTINDTKANEHQGLHLEYAECTEGTAPAVEEAWHNLQDNHQVKATQNENIFVRLSDDTNHKGHCNRGSCEY